MNSIWRQECDMPGFEPVRGELRTDVLVIGGGIAGLLCAHFLRQSGVDCLLVEAGRLCGGVTQNTTAKITSQHGFVYHTLVPRFGTEGAGIYYQANQWALAEYRRLCAGIGCDFSPVDSFVYSRQDAAVLEREMAALSAIGAAAERTEDVPLPIPTVGAIRFPDQAQFHPLKFLSAIAKPLNIREHSPVRALAPGLAITDQGRIRAEAIVVATHFPILDRHGGYFLKLYQHRSYVLALENAPALRGMYVDGEADGLSFRMHRGQLILGGGSHRTGKSGGGWAPLEAFAQTHYPRSAVRARWATQDCMSLDAMPYIGAYSRQARGLYVATGFCKWGMTWAMAGGKLLSDRILGRDNPWAALVRPSRSMLRPQLAVNGWEAALSLLTPSVPRCPHMGCALKWNPQEHSWDCPCHGSRFTRKGALLENPADGDLKNPPEK